MSVYIVTGKLGNGKTLGAVSRIKTYLQEGKRIATNLDIFLENWRYPNCSTIEVIRIPDKPNIDHLDSLGLGYEGPYDESKSGLLVLDECGTWFNSRNWNDPQRKKVIDWFLHSRKLRWDVILIIQDISLLDKQARDSLAEHTVWCRRMDKLRIPFLGAITKAIGYEVRLPRFHLGIVKYGDNKQSLTVDKWWYRGEDLYNLYDTEQYFVQDDSAGNYTYLTPWHLKGRYLEKPDYWGKFNESLIPILRYCVFYPAYYCSKVAKWLNPKYFFSRLSFFQPPELPAPLLAQYLKSRKKRKLPHIEKRYKKQLMRYEPRKI
jgi:hypothetical protein